MPQKFGERIKRGREHAGLSIVDLAEKIGVSRSSQLNYESGRTIPTLDYIEAWKDLGLSPYELLGLTSLDNKLDYKHISVQITTLIEQNIVKGDVRIAPLLQSLLDLIEELEKSWKPA
jgi:transcriptional regulator with XRE-family HTH domain